MDLRRSPGLIAAIVGAVLVATIFVWGPQPIRLDLPTSILSGRSPSTEPATKTSFDTDETAYAMVVKARPGERVIRAFAAPDDGSEVVATITNDPEYPIHFLGVADSITYRNRFESVTHGGDWLEVLLPVRPNGTTGWIKLAGRELSRNPFRVSIDVADHQLVVFNLGEIWLETPIAVGTGSTPTPIGLFYTTELLRAPNPRGAYGPFAFGLSGFSDTLTNFNGGEGVIGIHGTNRPESIGRNVSHGCVRVENEVIEELAMTLPLGTPVEITQ